MATTTIVPENAWSVIESRSLELFCTHRNLTADDALLAALVEQRAPALAGETLRLIEQDGMLCFSLAFKIARLLIHKTEAEPLPFEEVQRAA